LNFAFVEEIAGGASWAIRHEGGAQQFLINHLLMAVHHYLPSLS